MKTSILTLQEISPYLPYNLQVLVYGDEIANLKGIEVSQKGELYFYCQHPKYLGSYNKYGQDWIYNLKLILRPLSDLTKEIEVNGERVVPFKELINLFGAENINSNLVYPMAIDIVLEHPFEIVNKLISWHFDVFGLIEQGLAIDINTLNK